MQFEVGRDATGTATITGAGSTVIVSNDEGRFYGPYDYEAGFMRVARTGDGTLSILDGGRLEVRSGDIASGNADTTAPGFQLAREAGSVDPP